MVRRPAADRTGDRQGLKRCACRWLGRSEPGNAFRPSRALRLTVRAFTIVSLSVKSGSALELDLDGERKQVKQEKEGLRRIVRDLKREIIARTGNLRVVKFRKVPTRPGRA